MSLVIFWGKGFKCESSVWNVCHDVLIMSIDVNSIAILNVDGVD